MQFTGLFCKNFHRWTIKLWAKKLVTFSEYFSSLVMVRLASSFCHQIETSVTSALSTAQSKETSSPSRTIFNVSPAAVGSTWRGNRTGDTCSLFSIVRLAPAAQFGSHVHSTRPVIYVRIQPLGQHSVHCSNISVAIKPTFYAFWLGAKKRRFVQ